MYCMLNILETLHLASVTKVHKYVVHSHIHVIE